MSVKWSLWRRNKEKLKATVENYLIPVTVDTLEEAEQKRMQLVMREKLWLLSPACASWDQFVNFEVRVIVSLKQ